MGQSLHIPKELLDYILSFIDDESEFLNRHFVLEMSLWNSYFYEWTNNNLFWKDRYFFLLQKVQISSINSEIKDYKESDQNSFQFKYEFLFHYLNLNEKIEKLKYKTNEYRAELTAIEEWKIKNREKPTKFNNLYSTNLTCLYYCDQINVFLWSAYNFERHFVNNRNLNDTTNNNYNNANLYSSGTVMTNEKETDCRDFIEIISLNEILSEESQYSIKENLHGCLLLFEVPKTEHCGPHVMLVGYDYLEEREKVLKEYVNIVKGFPKELKIISDSSLNSGKYNPAKICNVGIDVPKEMNQVLDILHSEIFTKKEKRELMDKIFNKLNQELTFLQEKEQELKKENQENEQKVAQTEHNNEELIQNQVTETKKNCFLM
ncbi:hypothetical protein ABK040_014505 [Willaertia magna]